MKRSFDYCIIRVVPRVEREEFLNAGVVVYCLAADFLDARVALDPARLAAFSSGADADTIRGHLEAIPKICRGEGPIGALAQKERWHWLVSPRSTLVQPGPVHSGLCDDPATALQKLFTRSVG